MTRRAVMIATGAVIACGGLASALGPDLAVERTLAARVSESRMVETVRSLVGFGPRTYGTPSNHEAAAWLASAFRDAGLEVAVRRDAPRRWYQPTAWSVRISGEGSANGGSVLDRAWPSLGSPPATGAGPVSIGAAPGAVCLLAAEPTPESSAGCAAVLAGGEASPSGWPVIGRLRGSWSIPVFTIAPSDAASLRARVAAGERLRASFALEARAGQDGASTVVATLPGRDRSQHVLLCAHGDADSGGPGANDNASGVAIVLEVARVMAAAVKAGVIPQPAWDVRFAVWGGEMSSARQYLAAMATDPSSLRAVVNYDQSGFGSTMDALYVEPDDVAVNRELVTLVRGVMRDHLGQPGFPARAASVRTQGGTDSYVFQNTRVPGAPQYPAVTLYTSAWDQPRAVPVTDGFPPLNWDPRERPGMVTVDGDAFYHSTGDTPANTTDVEPSNMGWCARVGVVSLLRLMPAR